MLVILLLILCCFIAQEKGFCQRWMTSTNRIIYSLSGKAENLSWDMDYEGKRLFNAQWVLYNDNAGSKKILISVAGLETGIGKNVFHPNATSLNYMQFGDKNFTGNILLHRLESSTYHRIGCLVTFYDVYHEYHDMIRIRYAAFTPVFSHPLSPSQRTFVEGSPTNKNIDIVVTIKGNPKPTVLWKLNNKDIVDNSRMEIRNVETVDGKNDTTVKSVLRVDNFIDNDNGVLRVIGKYGGEVVQSPVISAMMNINVQYAPKEISLTTNITTPIIKNHNYVKLMCHAKANPPPTYRFQKASYLLHNGKDTSIVYYVTGVHEARFASFTCTASNTFGNTSQNLIIDLDLEDSDVARYMTGLPRTDSNWWIYFIIGAIILLLLFLGISLLSFIMRRRMRSLTIKHEPNERREPRRTTRYNYRINNTRLDFLNQAYDLNKRGTPDGTTRTKSPKQLQEFTNSGFEVHEEEGHSYTSM